MNYICGGHAEVPTWRFLSWIIATAVAHLGELICSCTALYRLSAYVASRNAALQATSLRALRLCVLSSAFSKASVMRSRMVDELSELHGDEARGHSLACPFPWVDV